MNIIENWGGLEYVTIRTKADSLPMKTLMNIERDLAIRIIKERPIRGKELRFLRKQLQLSCAKLAITINGDLSASAITKIENKENERLSPVNETYFRVFFAEKFKVQIDTRADKFVPKESNEPIVLAA